jgi:hypothetical protein
MTYKLDELNKKMSRLKRFFMTEFLQINNGNIRTTLGKFLELKECMGNIGNDIHFLASCLANSFLNKRHGVTIDLNKAVGSAGLDIDLEDIVAEIKTTIPYLENDFGAAQKREIKKDLERLENANKKHKYFFVINDKTERILKQKYSRHYPSVKIVNLLKEDL